MYKFRNTSLPDYSAETRTALQTQFFSALSIALQVADVAFLFLTYFFGYKVRINVKMIGSLVIMLVAFVISAGLIYVNTDSCM